MARGFALHVGEFIILFFLFIYIWDIYNLLQGSYK